MIECRYDMTIQVPISRRDTGNWEKAIGDLLQKVGVVSNDGNVHNLTTSPVDRDDCAVFLTPLPDMGGIRKAASTGYKTYEPRTKKPSVKKIAAFERIRSKVNGPTGV